jgi:hypothetical protein
VADTCLSVLLAAQELQGVPILFLEIGAWGKQDDAVLEAAVNLRSDRRFSHLGEQLIPVRLRGKVRPEHAFVLDPTFERRAMPSLLRRWRLRCWKRVYSRSEGRMSRKTKGVSR